VEHSGIYGFLAVTAQALRYGKGAGAVGAIVYDVGGGSEAFARTMPLGGLAQLCAAQQGGVVP